MRKLFRDLEERLLRSEVRRARGEVEALLAADFFEFRRYMRMRAHRFEADLGIRVYSHRTGV